MSMERSRMTLRGRMSPSMARVITMGARCPWTAAAPRTRSANESAFSMFGRVDIMVATGPGRWPTALRRASTLLSRSVTLAPAPMAALAADRPRVPAPMTTSCAGGTPGAPPKRMPLPPKSFSRSPAPSVMARPPAISDMLVRMGARPRTVLDGLEAHRGHLTLHEGLDVLGPGRRQAPESEDDLARRQHLVLARLGCEDAGHEPRSGAESRGGCRRWSRRPTGSRRRRGPRTAPAPVSTQSRCPC